MAPITRPKRKLIPRMLLMIGSSLAALVAAEIVMRFTDHRLSLPVGPYYPQHYLIPDERASYDISENFPPSIARCDDAVYPTWSNELGCFDKPYNGEKRYILLAGDSFTWGFAPFEDKYGTVLENYLGMRVLKCGVTGYGTKQELLKIRKVLAKVENRPQLIIVGYYIENDYSDDWHFPRYTVVEGCLVDKTMIVDLSFHKKDVTVPPEEVKKKLLRWNGGGARCWLYKHSIIYNMFLNSNVLDRLASKIGPRKSDLPQSAKLPPDDEWIPMYYEKDKYPWLEEAWQEHLRTIKEVKYLSDRVGARLLIVLIPAKEQVYPFLRNDVQKSHDLGKINAALHEFCDREKIECLDLLPAFRRYAKQTPRKYMGAKDDLYWRLDPHWNAKGNRLAGLLIAECILDRDLCGIGSTDKNRRIKAELDKLRESR